MPNKCCVPNCHSNYTSNIKQEGYIPVFVIPKDEERRTLWLSKMPNPMLTVTPNTVVCVKHFDERYRITTAKQTKDGTIVSVIKLTRDAIPTLFDESAFDFKPRRHSFPAAKRMKISYFNDEQIAHARAMGDADAGVYTLDVGEEHGEMKHHESSAYESGEGAEKGDGDAECGEHSEAYVDGTGQSVRQVTGVSSAKYTEGEPDADGDAEGGVQVLDYADDQEQEQEEQDAANEDDELDYFGKFVAASLKKISNARKRSLAMIQIQRVLLRFEYAHS